MLILHTNKNYFINIILTIYQSINSRRLLNHIPFAKPNCFCNVLDYHIKYFLQQLYNLCTLVHIHKQCILHIITTITICIKRAKRKIHVILGDYRQLFLCYFFSSHLNNKVIYFIDI